MFHILSNAPLQCLQPRRLKILAHLAFFLCTFVQPGLPATISCYFPDGTFFDGGMTYLTNGTNTMCCASGDVCTTSGWCLGSSGYLYRGGCTNRSWTSNACMNICKDQSGGLEMLYPCWGGYFTRTFCCSGLQTESCCANNFTFPGYFSGQSYLPGQFQALSVLESSTSSTSSSSQQTGTATVSSSSQSTSSNTSRSSPGMSVQSTLGLAVGLPLGVLAVGILAFLIWRERGQRSKKKGEADMQSHVVASPNQHDLPVRHTGGLYQTPEFRNELPAHG